MNRKRFLLWGLAASAGAAPLLLRWRRAVDFDQPLRQPSFLAHLLDLETLRRIGSTRRSAVPSESSAEELTRLLLANPGGPPVSADDASAVQDLLDRKVQADFETGAVVTLDGWILSVTEARQCALLSLTGG